MSKADSLLLEKEISNHADCIISLAAKIHNNLSQKPIKIKTADDLPKIPRNCWFHDKEKGWIIGSFMNSGLKEIKFILSNATHYIPITTPDPIEEEYETAEGYFLRRDRDQAFYYLKLYRENNYHPNKFGKIRSGVVFFKNDLRIWKDPRKGYMYQYRGKDEECFNISIKK